MLTDPTTRETRIYRDDGTHLYIHVEKPAVLTNCAGPTLKAIEISDFVVNHGDAQESFRMDLGLAELLSVNLTAMPKEMSDQLTAPVAPPAATDATSAPARPVIQDHVQLSYPSLAMIQSLVGRGSFAPQMACPKP